MIAIRPYLRRSCFVALALSYWLSASAHAEWRAGFGLTPDKDGDSTQALVVTYIKGHLDLEAGYVNKRVIDRNRFNLGPAGRRVPGYGYLSVRYRWQWSWGKFEPFFATGGLVASQTSTLSSSHFQFSHALGVRRGQWEVSWRHFSNADLAEQNEGDDILVLQYHF